MGKTLGGGAVLAAILLGVAIFTIAGGFASPQEKLAVTDEVKAVHEVENTAPVPPSGVKNTTTVQKPNPTVTPTPTPAPVINPKPHFRSGATQPTGDTITIKADAPNMVIDMAGWRVRSTVSGKAFVVPTVLSRAEGAETKQIHIGSTGSVVVVHSAGLSTNNHFTNGEYHLYFGEQTVAWKEHDTIQLVSPGGEVVDTYTY